MKISEARQAMNRQMDLLDVRRSKLQKLLEESSGTSSFDRIELSKELEAVDKAYEATFNERERLNEISAAIHNAEVSKQQAEAQAEANEELMKCLEIFRRIANGDKVPPTDEQKLMEYDGKLYMAAKNMAVLHMNEDAKEHDSLWGDEEEKPESPDASEVANNTEVTLSLPEMPAESSPDVTG